MYDNEVYECFRNTLARAKKVVRTGAAAEAKSAIEEFELLMERIHSQANGEELLDGDAADGGAGGLLDLGEVAVALQELDSADANDDHGN